MRLRMMTRMMMAAALAGAAIAPAAVNDSQIAEKIAHEVRMYSRYTIWDNVNIRVEDGQVALLGQVSEPFKKADLGRIAQSVEGVAGVANQLEVLPLSPFDNDIRLRVARAVYGDPTLSRYGNQALPPIHIIVDNGRVTLEGVVNSEMEKQIAGMRASGAGLSLGAVTNNLRVENPRKNG